MDYVNQIICGDCLDVLKELPDGAVDCCVTSPPYWGLRDYGVEGQLGLEKTPEEYVAKMVEVFREVRRVLKPEGTLWLNLGDSYNGSGGAGGDYNTGGLKEGQPKYGRKDTPTLKPKDLVGIPWMVAFALRADGWWLRQDIIWAKPNPMPESVTDRCTKSHEYIFLMSKSAKYYYDNDAIREPHAEPLRGKKKHESDNPHNAPKESMAIRWTPEVREYNPAGRNKRSVWTVNTHSFSEAHFATFPPKLIEPCILGGCPEGGIVLDPFMGAATTALTAYQNRRNYLGIELNLEYIKMAERRLNVAKEKFGLFESS